MRVLEVEQPGDATIIEHELERVVGDEPRTGEPVVRHVLREPTAEEHLDGVGRVTAHRTVMAFLHPAQEREPRGRRVVRDREAGGRRCVERDRVNAGKHLEVLLEERVTLGVVSGTGEVDQTGEPVHDESIRIVAEPVGVRHRDTVFL